MGNKTGFSILFCIIAILGAAIANGAMEDTDIIGSEGGMGTNDSVTQDDAQIIDANPGGTDLAGENPTRGFVDSDQVDVWVPFSFNFSPPENLGRARIAMVVKPIGQLIGTDQLILKGADGQGKVVYDNFNSLKANEWNTVEVDVSENIDVMVAIRTGHLEGMIQDDTAVQSVKLIIESVPNPPSKITPSPVMTPTPEELAKWIGLYESAPEAPGTISSTSGRQQNPSAGDYIGDSFSLLPYLQYNSNERNQGDCADCWQWAGTAVMEIQLAYSENIRDRLSVEYINSNIESSGDDKPCCGGCIDYFSKFYSDRGQAIPWTNFNADWRDGKSTCGRSAVPPDSTSTSPAYPIESIQTEKVPTHGVGSAIAIDNIKNVLSQGKAIWFVYFLPNSNEWTNFGNFWLNQREDTIYVLDAACGTPYDYEGGGGHAVVIVGYDETDPNNRYWIALNSWGTANGLRPNGLFRVNMDMNYDCQYPTNNNPNYLYATFFETLDVTYSIPGARYSGDLTGVWDCDDGGTYYLRQIGNILWWDGDGGSPGTWCNVAYGTIDGNAISLDYADVPEGSATGFGKLILNIISNDQLEATSKPESYGGSIWWRSSEFHSPQPPLPIGPDPWNDPSIRSLIDEWLRQQDNCVKDVYPNAYVDSWGRICGETQTAIISCTLTPDKPADWDNYHYLWEKNWCPDYYPYSVQEYVSLREYGLDFDDLAECKAKGERCYS